MNEMTTSIIIYSPSGEAVHEAYINKDSKIFRQLGGDYYIEISFNVVHTLDLPKGSYIDISDPSSMEGRYSLKSDASPEPILGVDGYKYALKFYAEQHEMEHCQVKWFTGNLKELSFRLTTSLKGYAKLISDNMNTYLDTDRWGYDEQLDDVDMREMSFEGVSCWDAINNISTTFGVEWWVEHSTNRMTIRFGKCEKEGDATDIREGEVVNRFPARKRGEDSDYGTRFYIFGGSQNVPDDYRKVDASTNNSTFHISEKRICLQKFAISEQGVAMGYIPYYDAISGLSTAEIVEKTIILDDIFPKNESTIREGDISSFDEAIIEGQERQPVYYINVDSEPKLLSTLGITFTSGALAGRSFGAEIIKGNQEYKIKVI